jgi:Tol biopolymer transport system component
MVIGPIFWYNKDMKTKILIIAIVVIALAVGGFFIYKNLSQSEPKQGEEGTEGLPERENGEASSAVEPGGEEEKETSGKEDKKPTPTITQLTQLTFLDNLVGDPDWSPDGSRLVFLGLEKNLMKGGLYIMNSNGTGISKIAGQWGLDHLFNPSWSPVNNKIICHGSASSPGPGGDGLFLVDLDGDETRRVQLSTQVVEHVSWSPDGKKIAYNVYNKDKSFSSIWVMNSDGSGKTQLTTSGNGFCTGPSFSYDGSKIVFLKGFTTTMPGEKPKEAINEIWVMNSDGSNKHMIYAPGDSMQLIRERAWNKYNKILFARHLPNKAPQIWVIDSNGTNPKCIFDPEAKGIPTAIYDDPVWDNSGTKVAVTKVILSDESWQIATFFWQE